MMRNLFLANLCILMSCTLSFQQHISQGECKYSYQRLNNSASITIASQIIHVENNRYDVYLNLCDALGKINNACDSNARACILRKRGTKKYKPNVTTSFHSQHVNGTFDDVTMIAKTNAKCEEGAFEFSVLFEKNAKTSKITASDECFMEITLPHPEIEFRDCAVAFNGFIMDLSPLRNIGERIFTLTHNNTKLAMSFCAPSASCSPATEASLCELYDGDVRPIASTQQLIYDRNDNSLKIHAKALQGKGKRKIEIHIHCNWSATFENLRKLPGNYKYSVDSKYGCVKQPPAHQAIDDENYEYDISALNRPHGWQVANSSTSFRVLVINIAGPLESSSKMCKDTYSQICGERKNGTSLSYGSLHSGLKANPHTMDITFTHGSICPHNSSFYLSTNVKLICYSQQQAPVLSSVINCTMDIVWKTPHACPKRIAAFSTFSLENIRERVERVADLNCSVQNADTGHTYRLKSLISPTMHTVIAATRKYYINICRNIQITNDTYLCKETPACVENMDELNIKHRFKWVGKVTNPTIENNELLIRYDGGYCVEEKDSNNEFLIHFNCSIGNELKLLRESPCKVEFIWNTQFACPQLKKSLRSLDCAITDNSTKLTLNFSAIDKKLQQFTVDVRNMNYTFRLCSDLIALTTADNIEKKTIKSQRLLSYNRTECHYSMVYTLLSNATKELLNSFKVDFLCDTITNNVAHIATKSVLFKEDNASIQILANVFCDATYYSCINEIQSPHDEIQEEIDESSKSKVASFNGTSSLLTVDGESHTAIIIGMCLLGIIILMAVAIFMYNQQFCSNVSCCYKPRYNSMLQPYARDVSD